MHPWNPLLRLWAIFLLSLGLAVSAAAQTSTDVGDYQILQALYGTAERHTDVTQRLRELARQDRSFRMGNDSLGTDPHPNQVKTLRIFARGRDGSSRTFEYAENSLVDGNLFSGWTGGNWGQPGPVGYGQTSPVIGAVPIPGASANAAGGDRGEYRILQANYGTTERNVDVTQRLRELARQDRSFRIGNDSFGQDPHPKAAKLLRIYARGKDGQIRTFEYTENSLVDGAQFTGWNSGNWGSSHRNNAWAGSPASGAGAPPVGPSIDSGEFQILQAIYGTAQRNADVTQQLKVLARQDRSFRMGNDSFGVDPHPNQVKTLRIHARGRDGQNRSFEYAEGSLVDGAQFTGWDSGEWGRAGGPGVWGEPKIAATNQNGYGPNRGPGLLKIVSASYGTSDRQAGVTYRLRARVQNDQLKERADNDLAGADPAPQQPKTLWVTYTLGIGQEQRVQVRENQTISLP